MTVNLDSPFTLAGACSFLLWGFVLGLECSFTPAVTLGLGNPTEGDALTTEDVAFGLDDPVTSVEDDLDVFSECATLLDGLAGTTVALTESVVVCPNV